MATVSREMPKGQQEFEVRCELSKDVYGRCLSEGGPSSALLPQIMSASAHGKTVSAAGVL